MIKALKKKRKIGNKGFSLVELIIVIAIMAVLVAILAPQYLKYVEKSRKAADDNYLSEVKHAAIVSLADETIYTAMGTGATVTWDPDGTLTTTVNALTTELTTVVDDSYEGKSKAYTATDAGNYTLVITLNEDGTYSMVETFPDGTVVGGGGEGGSEG
jgi:type IV pilus assembly protein PilA